MRWRPLSFTLQFLKIWKVIPNQTTIDAEYWHNPHAKIDALKKHHQRTYPTTSLTSIVCLLSSESCVVSMPEGDRTKT